MGTGSRGGGGCVPAAKPDQPLGDGDGRREVGRVPRSGSRLGSNWSRGTGALLRLPVRTRDFNSRRPGGRQEHTAVRAVLGVRRARDSDCPAAYRGGWMTCVKLSTFLRGLAAVGVTLLMA